MEAIKACETGLSAFFDLTKGGDEETFLPLTVPMYCEMAKDIKIYRELLSGISSHSYHFYLP